ncbi:MAG: metal ABC transporter permease, partial [Sulfolobales archaeon]
LTTFRVGYRLWSVILGDPLLITWSDLLYVSVVALLTAVLTVFSLKYHIYAGADPDYVKLVGARKWLYDFILFLLIGITSVALIKVTGFILQHILILLPSIVAARLTESSSKAYMISLLVSLTAGVVGLQLAVLINTSPSGMIGITLITIFVISLLLHKVKEVLASLRD